MPKERNKFRKQVLIGLAGATVTILAYQIYKKLTQTTHALAGPNPSNKELGNFGDMSKAGSLHEYLEQLTNTYGPIGAFWWGTQRVAYITSQKILLDEENKKWLNLSDRPPFLFDGFKPLITKHSIQYVNGAEFKAKYHDVFLAAYQRNMVSKLPILIKVTQQNIDDWTRLINLDISDTPSTVIDMKHCGFVFSSKSVIFSSFGANISEDACERIVSGYEPAWHEMEKRLVDGIPSDAARDAKFEDSLNLMRSTIQSILKESESNDSNDESFINYVSKHKNLYPTEEKVLAEAITAVVGGTHTTGTALTWLFYYVARNPMIQDKMYNEIKRQFDVDAVLGEMEAKTVSNKVKKLMYCRQVIMETLRISSVAPWAARVNYNEEMILNACDGTKVKIPKGMAFIIGQGVALKDGNVFQNPCVFDPDRWCRKNLKNNKIAQQSQDAIFGGLGGRMCPGWLFFRMEALVFIVGIFCKFKFEMVNGDTVDTTYGLVAGPKQDVKIKVTKR
eukprot:230506_1